MKRAADAALLAGSAVTEVNCQQVHIHLTTLVGISNKAPGTHQESLGGAVPPYCLDASCSFGRGGMIGNNKDEG